MSAEDTSDRREPVDDGFDEELAMLLSDDWHPASEKYGDGEFDVSDFLRGLYNVDSVFFLPAAIEVPLSAFHDAQRADVLHELEIVADRHGHMYLVGIVISGGDQIVIASASLENRDDS